VCARLKKSEEEGTNLYTRNRVQELEKAKTDLEKNLEHLKNHYEKELEVNLIF
jgi:hypothetical protein